MIADEMWIVRDKKYSIMVLEFWPLATWLSFLTAKTTITKQTNKKAHLTHTLPVYCEVKCLNMILRENGRKTWR